MSTTEPRISIHAEPPPTAQKSERSRRLPGIRLAILAGLLLWLSAPPFGLWPMAWVAVAPFILSVTRATRFRQALWRGYLFGWAYLGAVCYWVGLTINGWTNSQLGWIAWFLLTFILAGYYALFAGGAWWLSRRLSGGWRVVGLAAAWTLLEWIRTVGTLTMPWAQLSYSQFRFLPVLQIAEFTGAYGITFVLMLVNVALADWWPQRGKPGSARWVWLTSTLGVMICLFGLAKMQAPAGGPALRVASMQSNFSVHETLEDIPINLMTFSRLTRKALTAAPDLELMVWSESAAPGDALYYMPTRQAIQGLAYRDHIPIMVGSHVSDPMPRVEANASLLFLPRGGNPLRYDKRQLVPFGEFIPFRGAIPESLGKTFSFFDSDITPGDGAHVMRFQTRNGTQVAAGPFICYESMYPDYARSEAAAGANLLVTQSNDAWFRSRAAMEQHLAAVVLRGVENRRDVVRSTTSGITCLIDSTGKIFATAPRERPTFITGTVHLHSGKTLYTICGDWIVALCSILIGFGVWKQGQRPGNPGERQQVAQGETAE